MAHHSSDRESDGEIELRALVAVEHAVGEDEFTPYKPSGSATIPVRAGDRVWFSVEVPANAWVYGIGSKNQAHFEREWVSASGEGSARLPWPDGRVVDERFPEWDRFLVVASYTELDWVVPEADCYDLVGKSAPDPPRTPCDHLYGLFEKVHAVRGRVEPPVGTLVTDDKRLPAVEATQTRKDLAVVIFNFNPREKGQPERTQGSQSFPWYQHFLSALKGRQIDGSGATGRDRSGGDRGR